jgi:hypothetical protein
LEDDRDDYQETSCDDDWKQLASCWWRWRRWWSEGRFFGQYWGGGCRLSGVVGPEFGLEFGREVAGLVRVVGSGDKVFDVNLAKILDA